MAGGNTNQQSIAERLPVSVLTTCREVKRASWDSHEWDVIGVVGAQHGGGPAGRMLIREEPGEKQYICTGYFIELFKDAAEGYYHNLMGESPKVFVVCQQEEGEELEPLLVTVSYDEATAHMEMEEAVFSVPLPPEIYRIVEQFVVANYIPEKRKKRKRDDWKEQDPTGHGPKRRHGSK